MKSNLKRILSLVFCLLLCLSLVPTSHAEDTDNAGDLAIDSKNFPCSYFRRYISTSFDANQDNALSKYEISKIKEISGLGFGGKVTSLKGIEHFSELQALYCQDQEIKEINISKNKKLTVLNCANNPVKKLKLNTELTELTINGCKEFGTLDPSVCPKLKVFRCSNINLVYLDLSGNKELTDLDCSNNQLGTLDLSGNKALKKLKVKNNPLSELYVHPDAPLKSVSKGQGVRVIRGKPSPLSAPCPKVTLNEGGKPQLQWEAVRGAVKYQIYCSTTQKTGSFKRIATVTGTQFTHKKAEGGTMYYYKVRAIAADGSKGGFGPYICERAKTAPGTPKLTGSYSSKGKPALSWQAVKGAEKVQIYRSTTGKAGSFKLLGTTTGLSYTNRKAVAGTTYYYKVRAVSKEGVKGDWSAVLKLTAKVAPGAPDVTGSLNAKGKPVLRWEPVEGAVKYEIYRSVSYMDGVYKRISTVSGLTFTNVKAEAGKTYFYKVRAVSEDGIKGPWSELIELKSQ